eukprot:scaffold21494_cov55-Phaeocystis_antarctica.AAC.6
MKDLDDSAARLSLTLFFSCCPCPFLPPGLNLLSPLGLPLFLPIIRGAAERGDGSASCCCAAKAAALPCGLDTGSRSAGAASARASMVPADAWRRPNFGDDDGRQPAANEKRRSEQITVATRAATK